MRNKAYREISGMIFSQVLESMHVSNTRNMQENKEHCKKLISSFLEKIDCVPQSGKKQIKKDIFTLMFGLGPLDELMNDKSISEIMVNGMNEVYAEKGGIISKTDIRFHCSEDLINIINRIVGKVGRRIDESSPLVDARLPDGSRVNAIIPPLSLNGPLLTIRKFPKKVLELDDLVSMGSMNDEMKRILEKTVKEKRNIMIAGGTGSGKTTLLNALVNRIEKDERIITIEDSAEIRTSHPHRISLESRPANIEGAGEINVRALLKNALRMRPDRIIIGEIRGSECIDMLQAMNTGHKGSLCTVHANSDTEALLRMETMALMSGVDLPLAAIREQIISAIDIIVYQARKKDGSRIIETISQMDKKTRDKYILTNLLT